MLKYLLQFSNKIYVNIVTAWNISDKQADKILQLKKLKVKYVSWHTTMAYSQEPTWTFQNER